MKVTITRTTPIYTTPDNAGVFVQWDVTEPPQTPITFSVERAESPEGPFTALIANLTDMRWYDAHRTQPCGETGLNFLSLQRNIYYRVTAQAAGAADATALNVVGDGLPPRQRLLRRKMQRDAALGFRFNGVEVDVLKRKHSGARCTTCVDKITKTVMNSKCLVCFGTGITGGYHTPVRLHGRKGTTSVQTSVAGQGTVEVNQIDFTLLDYPAMAVDDVIAEMHSNRRYVVKHVTRTELRGVCVHQKLVLSELGRDSIEYRIVLGNGTTPALY